MTKFRIPVTSASRDFIDTRGIELNRQKWVLESLILSILVFSL